MSEMIDLYECPFSDHHQTEIGVKLSGDDEEGWQVFCFDCHAAGPWAQSSEDAATLWNRAHGQN